VTDHPRILELRRRVQADPASIAFAQLAEECRRAGHNDEAVGICRAGLAHHPDYLSARVTLGRALVEIGRLDEALGELSLVFERAPTNLPAIRALAEIYQQQGRITEALQHYRLALGLAKFDADLEDAVEQIAQQVTPAPAASPAPPAVIEELFDFDTLLSRLGPAAPAAAPLPEAPVVAAPSPLDTVSLPAEDGDAFAQLERQLREGEEQRLRDEHVRMAAEQRRIAEERQRRLEDERRLLDEQRRISEEQQRIAEAELAREMEAERQRALTLQDLDEWLSAIAVDRQHQRSA
jgi:tetratricopeptide (TPR) repeat protein